LDALVAARDSVTAFQRSTLPNATCYERDGIRIRQQWRPVERAGCYVPGGLAAYPSSVLMTAIPALVAGVDEVALCVPPRADGQVPASVLAAASITGVREVYRIGGVQAIAALAYGTASVASVDVIVGPGNIYVATAKRLVSGVVGVPSSFAGPSEVVVIADETTPVDHAAIDVIVQAEHGPDGLAWLVTWSSETAARINERIGELVATSPRRAAIETALRDGGYAVIVDDATAAMDIANAIAPEHLELLIADADSLVPQVRNAGAVFAGINSPASAGDYIAGPSHVLPVYGSARFGSALGVFDFLRDQHVIELDRAGLASATPHIVAIARAEGLDAHAQSVLMRQ
ncbi:MAG: histidinol dehydrogenase, partial [Acidimicrobiales bacterium]